MLNLQVKAALDTLGAGQGAAQNHVGDDVKEGCLRRSKPSPEQAIPAASEGEAALHVAESKAGILVTSAARGERSQCEQPPHHDSNARASGSPSDRTGTTERAVVSLAPQGQLFLPATRLILMTRQA